MVNQTITFEVDPGGKFKNAIQKAKDQVSDLSPAFMLIKNSWYQSNKAIFSLGSPGKYPPLGGLNPDARAKGSSFTNRQRAEARKRQVYGFDYPLLMATGRLMASMISSGGESIAQYNATSMFLGTSVPYAFYHQAPGDRKKLPYRPFIFIGAEQTAPDELNMRQATWIAIVSNYVAQVLTKQLRSA